MNCDVIDDSPNGGDSTGLEHKINDPKLKILLTFVTQ